MRRDQGSALQGNLVLRIEVGQPLCQRVALTTPLTQGSLGRMEVAGVGKKKPRSGEPNGVNYAM